jgi:hypothetical protein
MMNTFLPIFSLTIEHDYFADALTPNVQFTPSRDCAEMLRRWQLLLRQEGNCLEIWQEVGISGPLTARDVASNNAKRSQELCFTFEVTGRDPLFSFYTDLPRSGTKYANQEDGNTSDIVEYLVAADMKVDTTPDRHGQDKSNTFTVELHRIKLHESLQERMHDLSKEEESSTTLKPPPALKQYVVALKSKKIHWKYFFSGSLAKKKLHIVDVNAEENGLGVGFVDSSLSATKDGLAMISTSAIAMRNRPDQRFQLREAGAGERILIKRLPNASLAKIGKEKSRDGASMVVAEIYIHQ